MAPPSSFEKPARLPNAEINNGVSPFNLKHSPSEMRAPALEIGKDLLNYSCGEKSRRSWTNYVTSALIFILISAVQLRSDHNSDR